MEEIVESRRHREKTSSYEWKNALKRDAAQIFKDYIEPCSGFREHDRIPQMSMIASIQVDGRINIFRIRDTLVRKIKPLDHVSVGVGNLLATSLIDRHLKGANLTMEMTVRLGSYILERVKKSVANCGGYTEFYRQGVDGSLSPGYASGWGAGMAGLDSATTSLIYTALESDDAMFDKALGNLVQQVKNVRTAFVPDSRLRWTQFIEEVPPTPSVSRKSKQAR